MIRVSRYLMERGEHKPSAVGNSRIGWARGAVPRGFDPRDVCRMPSTVTGVPRNDYSHYRCADLSVGEGGFGDLLEEMAVMRLEQPDKACPS